MFCLYSSLSLYCDDIGSVTMTCQLEWNMTILGNQKAPCNLAACQILSPHTKNPFFWYLRGTATVLSHWQRTLGCHMPFFFFFFWGGGGGRRVVYIYQHTYSYQHIQAWTKYMLSAEDVLKAFPCMIIIDCTLITISLMFLPMDL